ncbi:MAG: AAA family ATPase [Anaerolineae bacterium]|nr:AAA family ATPase [Anaerolineae bacterium]MCB0256527.1 AAA family ATPase [Anaerolineae bacterium]
MTENVRGPLEQAIKAQESLRGTLPDAVVEATVAALREKLAALGPESRDERRKLVTVLFADLAGWTRMSERMDPEDVAAVQRSYFDAVTPAIHEHGGRVEKYIGDAILAVFGVPQAREDDPVRAVRAALAMQKALERLNAATSERARGETTKRANMQPALLRMRVGVHTGPVLAAVGERDEDFVVTGDTVNLASRLEGAAPPDGVLISHNTWRHVQGQFEVEPQAPLTVKGKDEPMQAYLVQRPRPYRFRDEARGVAGVETRMVGRDPELLILQNALQDVMADGELRLVTVVGEAGVGKSRLLYEFECWVEGLPESIWYFKGRARPETERQPYGLLRTILAARFGVADSDTLDQVRVKMYEGLGSQPATGMETHSNDGTASLIGQLLGYDFSDHPAVKPLMDNPRQLRERALAALTDYWGGLAAQGPLLLLLEDLHWADDSSLDALNLVAHDLADSPVLVLGTSRPELYRRRPHWGEGWAFHNRLQLRPLSKRAGRQLVNEILQRMDQIPTTLEAQIVEGAEGNPFFVEELVKMLIDDGVINADEERWQVDSQRLGQAHVPATLTGVLQARLDRLPAKERAILQQASVVGPVFWDRAVQALRNGAAGQDRPTGEELADLGQLLSALRSRELVYRRETSAFEDAVEHTFKHAVLRDVTYESVLKRLRQVYHGLVADWLIEQAGERMGEHVALIADHLEHAGRSHEAADFLVHAGDQARVRNAHEETVVAYQRALTLLEAQARWDEAARTCMKLGLAHHNAFDYRAARETFNRGFDLWQLASDITREAELSPAPHALRWDIPEPASIDPAGANDAYSEQVMNLLFCGLVALDEELAVAPDIARSWEISEDGCRYIFHLRDDVFWSDGVRVTAADFEYAWKRQLDPATTLRTAPMLYVLNHARAYHQGVLSNADQVGVRAVDDLTLVVELEEPAGYFLHLLTEHSAYPVPRHIVALHGDTWTEADKIVSNGPFLLRSWDRSHEMVFERNPTYHGKFRGNVDRVQISTYRDWSAKLQLYEADALDSLNVLDLGAPVTTEDRQRIWQRFAGDCVLASVLDTLFIGMDLSGPPFSDRRVRQALALATDKEALTNVAPHGFNVPATGGFVPPGIPGHVSGIGLSYDPELARRLLAQAGYPDGAGFPEIAAIGHHSVAHEVEFLRHHWRQNLGITVSWTLLDWKEFGERFQYLPYPRLPQLFMTGWAADYPDPDNFLRLGLSEETSSWHNDTFDTLIGEGNRATDQETRIQLFQQADRLLIQEAAIVPLIYQRWHILAKPWVAGLTGDDSFGGWKDVVIKPH